MDQKREGRSHAAAERDASRASSDDDALVTQIARKHAHFHRLLGALLVDLGEGVETHWLSEEGHAVTDDPERNAYAKAVYVVHDLGPFTARLAQLDDVRHEAMDLMGVPEPPASLLTPKVFTGVTEARILTNTGFASRTRKRVDVLASLTAQRDTTESALAMFQSFPERTHKRDEIAQELSEIDAALMALEASDAESLRQHYRYTRHMCHVYYQEPGAFDQIYVGDVGVVLQGVAPQVARHAPKRRKHRRTTGIEPLAKVGPYVFYEEVAWRAARERS